MHKAPVGLIKGLGKSYHLKQELEVVHCRNNSSGQCHVYRFRNCVYLPIGSPYILPNVTSLPYHLPKRNIFPFPVIPSIRHFCTSGKSSYIYLDEFTAETILETLRFVSSVYKFGIDAVSFGYIDPT